MVFRTMYTISKKVKVMDYFKTHTNTETAKHFGINKSMVTRWTQQGKDLAEKPQKSIKHGSGRRAAFPDIEEQVYQLSLDKRRQGLSITFVDIARDMRHAASVKYPDSLFVASSGWIKGFRRRFNVKSKTPTLFVAASKWDSSSFSSISEKHSEQIKDFFAFIDKHTLLHNYLPSRIINFDETPVYFNNHYKKTVVFPEEGKDAVAVKIMDGNHRARVTVGLACLADGTLMEPIIIEQGQSKAAKEDSASTRYSSQGLAVWKQCNNTMNTSIMVDWIDNWLSPQFNREERKLLIMDSAPSHKSAAVKEACKRNGFDIAMIPGGCTKYLQPLDLTVNRSYKSKLKQGYHEAMKRYTGRETANDRRCLLNENVKEARTKVSSQTVMNGWMLMNRMRK